MKIQKNKLFSSLLILIFISIISISFGNEYITFHQKNQEIIARNNFFEQNNLSFELSSINEIKQIELFSTPDKLLLEKIVSIIDNSKEYAYIEAYMLTENRIREAIIKAKNRGVDIKIILEKNPYLAYNINNNTFEDFSKRGIDVVWSNQKNYTLNHAKIMLIDSLSIISTGNFTYSTFTQNRDLFIFTYDENIHKSLIEVFNFDFYGDKNAVLNENLVLSPQNSRSKLNKLLDEAKEKINIYIPYFDDEQLVEKLINLKKEKNLDINAIIPKTAKEDYNTKLLENDGIIINVIPKYTLHSKSILIDEKYLFIGSINFSLYSIDSNREIGIILKEQEIIKSFQVIFEGDLPKN